jgi:carbonic anhydrase/SulP family sulfate permease
VLGHTRCGAVTAALDLLNSPKSAAEASGCQHLDCIVDNIQHVAESVEGEVLTQLNASEKGKLVDSVARKSVMRSVIALRSQSSTLDRLAATGRIAIVGAMYDVTTGDIEFFNSAATGDELTASM